MAPDPLFYHMLYWSLVKTLPQRQHDSQHTPRPPISALKSFSPDRNEEQAQSQLCVAITFHYLGKRAASDSLDRFVLGRAVQVLVSKDPVNVR